MQPQPASGGHAGLAFFTPHLFAFLHGSLTWEDAGRKTPNRSWLRRPIANPTTCDFGEAGSRGCISELTSLENVAGVGDPGPASARPATRRQLGDTPPRRRNPHMNCEKTGGLAPEAEA